MVLFYYDGEYEPDKNDLGDFFEDFVGLKGLTREQKDKLVEFIEEYVDFDVYKDEILDYFESQAEEYFEQQEEDARDYDRQVREDYYRDRI